MKEQALTTKPKTKADNYHGSCQIAWLPPAYEDTKPGMPKSLNLGISFEEALKLSLALQACLQSLNRYNRSIKKGKNMGVILSFKFDEKQVTVFEGKV
jgi:hypothetical protein